VKGFGRLSLVFTGPEQRRCPCALCYTDYGLAWYEKMLVGLRYFETFGLPPPRGLTNYSPGQLEVLLEAAGFDIEGIELLGDQPRALYAKARKSE
jgi:hypothetical protein